MRATITSALLLSLATGCPAQVNNSKPIKKAPVVQVDESDPRVIKDGEDLYAAKALGQEEPPVEGEINKGSGKPDETNGYCRLYAPKLPDPNCCKGEFGFDAMAAAKSCGKSLYLGESFHGTCGYFFMDPQQGEPVWFRSSFVEETTPKEAADAFANRVTQRFGADVKATALDGVEGAYTVAYEGLAYAWFKGDPSWSLVRRLAWSDDTCDDKGIQEVVAQMARSKAPKKGDRRLGLVPKARE